MIPENAPTSERPSGPSLDALLQHKEWVYRLARRMVQDRSRADDVVQEVWLAALQRRPTAERNLRPWLLVIARAAARKIARSEVRLQEREKTAAKAERLLAETSPVDREDTRRRLVQYVHELGELYRSTVLLHFFQNLSPQEIGRRLNVPGTTVRTRLKRGLDQLRVRLEHHYGDRSNWAVGLVPLAIEAKTGAASATAAAGATAGAQAAAGAFAFKASWAAAALVLVAAPALTLSVLTARADNSMRTSLGTRSITASQLSPAVSESAGLGEVPNSDPSSYPRRSPEAEAGDRAPSQDGSPRNARPEEIPQEQGPTVIPPNAWKAKKTSDKKNLATPVPKEEQDR